MALKASDAVVIENPEVVNSGGIKGKDKHTRKYTQTSEAYLGSDRYAERNKHLGVRVSANVWNRLATSEVMEEVLLISRSARANSFVVSGDT